ncbi:hypothetical protein EG329_012601 [Mollisiaceae sp. DMI_Dod_QoI]|nr:hypothetical protein EG329_012601 [Helotiales sp. DMI_Dod_QoI]
MPDTGTSTEIIDRNVGQLTATRLGEDEAVCAQKHSSPARSTSPPSLVMEPLGPRSTRKPPQPAVRHEADLAKEEEDEIILSKIRFLCIRAAKDASGNTAEQSSSSTPKDAERKRKASEDGESNSGRKKSKSESAGKEGEGDKKDEYEDSNEEESLDDGGATAEKCYICCDNMEDPILTDPCSHKFCRRCWAIVVVEYGKQKPKETTVPCPRCRVRVRLTHSC